MKPWNQRDAAWATFEASELERHPTQVRVVINLVGAPGSGKSTLATAFVKAHPDWAFLSIDAYMVSGLPHAAAWEAMRTHARLYPKVIVESSGLSYRIRRLLAHRHHATVIVTSEEAGRRRAARVNARPRVPKSWEHRMTSPPPASGCLKSTQVPIGCQRTDRGRAPWSDSQRPCSRERKGPAPEPNRSPGGQSPAAAVRPARAMTPRRRRTRRSTTPSVGAI